MGNAYWKLFCLEHGIKPNGEKESDDTTFNTFFSETDHNKVVPRSIFIDLEPTIIDEVRKGSYRELFAPDQLISGKEDTGGVFARGYYTVGRGIIELVLDRIRRLVDDCPNLEGFMIYNSIGGGTGSGLGSLLLETLSVDYGKKPKFCFSIYPSPKLANSPIETYNALFSTCSILEHADVCVVLDNEALYDICEKKLDLEKSSYTSLNRIIAQFISSLTTSVRFGGALNANLTEIQSNLIPYPRYKFMLSSYAPLVNHENIHKEQLSVAEITNSAFEPISMLTKCNPRLGKYMACCVMYRGDITPKEVSEAISDLKAKKTIKFVDWCPTGFKVGINDYPPPFLEGGDLAKVTRAVCTISNSNAIAQVFSKVSYKFDLLYMKRAFIYWYLREQMEEENFTEARQELAALEKDYDCSPMEMGEMEMEEEME